MPHSLTLPETALAAPTAIDHAIVRARHAQRQWYTRTVRQRTAVLRRLRHALASQAMTLAAQVARTSSRPCAEILTAEILPLADACRFLERDAPRLLAPRHLGAKGRPAWLHGVSTTIHREPFGVVLIVTPTNYPLFLPGVQALQALASGNAVLLKPGKGGLAAAQALTALLADAGMDPALTSVLSEEPSAVDAAIAAAVDHVIFTGAAATGATVLAKLAPRLIPATLELSGCDAAILCANADLDLAAQALAFSLRLNSGATCIAPRRVFVPAQLAARFTTLLVEQICTLEPLTVAPAHVGRAKTLVDEACRQGAHQRTGAFYPPDRMTPVLVTDTTRHMSLLQADLFAPVLALVTVSDENAALTAAQACPYALGATIFGHGQPAQTLAAQLNAGVVVLNDVIVPTADPRLPFGGRGRSGYGVTRGAEGLLACTTQKAITHRKGRWRPHYRPPHPTDSTLFQAYIRLVHGASWRERTAALLTCLRALAHSRRVSTTKETS